MRKMGIRELVSFSPNVFEFIQSNQLNTLEERRYELNSDDYVNIESYDTFKFHEKKFESHRVYLDIHDIISGVEAIYVESIDKLKVIKGYDNEKGIVFYDNTSKGICFVLQPGEMLLLEPCDGHKPCISVDKSNHVKKAVFKIRTKGEYDYD